MDLFFVLKMASKLGNISEPIPLHAPRGSSPALRAPRGHPPLSERRAYESQTHLYPLSLQHTTQYIYIYIHTHIELLLRNIYSHHPQMEATRERREQQQQQQQQQQKKQQDVKLPLESSPYVGYKDMEDYKMRGYGAHGHLPTVDQVGGGGTDAPTLSGSGLSERQAHVADPPAAP